MEIKLELNDITMPLAQLDTLINVLAHQKEILAFLCDNKATTIEEADSLYADAIARTERHYDEIYQNLYVKYSSVNPDDLLPKV